MQQLEALRFVRQADNLRHVPSTDSAVNEDFGFRPSAYAYLPPKLANRIHLQEDTHKPKRAQRKVSKADKEQERAEKLRKKEIELEKRRVEAKRAEQEERRKERVFQAQKQFLRWRKNESKSLGAFGERVRMGTGGIYEGTRPRPLRL